MAIYLSDLTCGDGKFSSYSVEVPILSVAYSVSFAHNAFGVLQVQQRDNEINILVSMLKKRKAAMGLNPALALQPGPVQAPAPAAAQPLPSTSYSPPTLTSSLTHLTPASPSSSSEPHYGSSTSNVAPLPHQSSSSDVSLGQLPGQLPLDQSRSHRHAVDGFGVQNQQSEGPRDLLDTSVLADRGKAFDLFR